MHEQPATHENAHTTPVNDNVMRLHPPNPPKVDVIHSQLTSRVSPNMEGNGKNEENIELWVKNEKYSSYKL